MRNLYRADHESPGGRLRRSAELLRILALPAVAVAAAACADEPGPTALSESASSVVASHEVVGAVYTSTNAAGTNEVLIFPRYGDGTIGSPSSVPTGGSGSGAGDLGSQGAVTLSPDGRWLLVVNAGSNEISLFSVSPSGLTLVDRQPSGGTMPVSVAVSRGTVYVLNAGGVNNVTGFWIERNGLRPIPNSTQPLSAASTAPAQVGFDPKGRILVVTEKATNVIATFDVARPGGTLSNAQFNPSTVPTPFGFAFDPFGRLFVSEAAGGMPGASALSSYSVSSFSLLGGPEGTTQTAACWVVITPNGRLAFTTNTGSGTVSAFEIGQTGTLALLQPIAANTGAGSGPIDMALERSGTFMYVLAPGNGTLRPYSIAQNGILTGLGPVSGLPSSSFGVAAW